MAKKKETAPKKLSEAEFKKHLEAIEKCESMEELTAYVHPLEADVKNQLVKVVADQTDKIVFG